MMNKNIYINGYSMIELLLSVIVGSVVLAGAYTSYNSVSMQFNANKSGSEINEMAVPTLRVLSKAIKKAGFKAVDTQIESDFGRIQDPITIIDSGSSACCDEFTIIYDEDLATRYRERYYIAARSGLGRKALFLDKEIWNETSEEWDDIYISAIVTDYIEDMQLEIVEQNSNSQPVLIDMNLIFRSRSKKSTPQIFTKNAESTGNYIFTPSTENVNYTHQEFETTILLRNLMEN